MPRRVAIAVIVVAKTRCEKESACTYGKKKTWHLKSRENPSPPRDETDMSTECKGDVFHAIARPFKHGRPIIASPYNTTMVVTTTTASTTTKPPFSLQARNRQMLSQQQTQSQTHPQPQSQSLGQIIDPSHDHKSDSSSGGSNHGTLLDQDRRGVDRVFFPCARLRVKIALFVIYVSPFFSTHAVMVHWNHQSSALQTGACVSLGMGSLFTDPDVVLWALRQPVYPPGFTTIHRVLWHSGHLLLVSQCSGLHALGFLSDLLTSVCVMGLSVILLSVVDWKTYSRRNMLRRGFAVVSFLTNTLLLIAHHSAPDSSELKVWIQSCVWGTVSFALFFL
jgi:hypothetical protein